MTRPSRQHWHLQTRSGDGWLTQAHPAMGLAAIQLAESYAESGIEARVLLGGSVYYATGRGMAASLGDWRAPRQGGVAIPSQEMRQ